MSNEKAEYLFTLGGRLAEQRAKIGHTQRSLADLFDISSRTQIKYESGATAPDAAYMHGIHMLGMDVYYILTGESSPKPITVEEKIILTSYRELGDQGRAALLGMLDGFAKSLKPTTKNSSQTITVHGDIGQQVAGDITAPQTINVGRKKK